MIIANHYNGPPDSGNGGYTCGLIAQQIGDSSAEVTLRKPIPLDREMSSRWQDEQLQIWLNDELIATAKATQFELEIPTAVSFDAATQAAKNYLGLQEKLAFPTCFVCGTDRPAEAGLHLYAGRLAKSDNFAASWIPAATYADERGFIRAEFIWAALDCPGAYAAMGDRKLKVVLGRLTAEIKGKIRAGEKCVVQAWPLGQDGRKHFSGTALYKENGEVVARAKAVWFEI